jgi:hypothetical protein
MALDFGMLQPVNISGQLMAGQQQAQQNQLAQQQLKQSGMQMEQTQLQVDQLKRDRDALAKLQEQFVANGKSPDLEENFGAMIQSGIPHFVDIGTQGLQKIQQQKQFASIMGGGAAAPAAPAASVNALAPAAAAPATSVNALASGSDVSGLRQKRDALLAMGTQQSIAAAKALDADIALAAREPVYHNVPGVGLVDPRTKQVIMHSVESTQPEIKQYEYAKAQGYKGSLFDFKREMAMAGRAPAAPRPESAPVAVVDPVTGKQVLVSREEAISKRLSPATAIESLPPKEIQKREAALPQATSAVQGFESKSDKFIADLKALRDDPGLENITGAIFGRTGSVTREGSRAQALYDKVIAKGGFQALQDLRDASKTGGALGNVSNQEGKQLIASFSAIDRRQNAEDVRAAIDQAISDIEGTKTRMREAYDSTYSYKNGGASAPAAPPAPAGGTLSPAEQAELAALRKRFGK